MRRLAWIGGFVLAACLLILLLAVTLGRPETPFAFLVGRRPTDLSHRPKASRTATEPIWYCFEGDVETVLAEAREELLAKGYEEVPALRSRDMAGYGIGDWRRVQKTGPVDRGTQIVTVKIGRENPLRQGHFFTKGWVTVSILGEPPRTLFDRLRSWLGI